MGAREQRTGPNSPLQGELLRSQEDLAAADVKDEARRGLMGFDETDPPRWKSHTPCRVSVNVITQMNPIKRQAEQDGSHCCRDWKSQKWFRQLAKLFK